jgi:hypothetical protein
MSSTSNRLLNLPLPRLPEVPSFGLENGIHSQLSNHFTSKL